MKIVRVRERDPSEFGFTTVCTGGPQCGTEIRMVFATMEDGSERPLFKTNVREGIFRQIYVPWDMKVEGAIDPHT
jgi:hypothetical protein